MKIQFQNLITPLTEEEFNQLTESIKKDGCRDVLIVWNDILLDGHNRLKICDDNNIKYKIKEIQLKDKSEAEIWIIKNQFARRNLSDLDRMELAEKLRDIITKKAKKNLSEGGKISQKQGSPISAKAVETDVEIAKIAGVGKTKIKEYRAIKNNIKKEFNIVLKKRLKFTEFAEWFYNDDIKKANWDDIINNLPIN